jgi:membrane-associated phospholipid phosphatase
MTSLFYKFLENVFDCFKGKNLIYHLLAIGITFIIVVSGFDWKYYTFFNGTLLYYVAFSAAALGGLIPILLPVGMLIIGKINKNPHISNAGFAVAQAAVIGSLISSFYKMFTGRLHPGLGQMLASDITHTFQFGLFRGGIFWGWPSSHATIAFATAFTLWVLYSKNKTIRTLALVYAFFIGIGVSMTIHWFSDFVAGAIIGTVIGLVVGRSFRNKYEVLS